MRAEGGAPAHTRVVYLCVRGHLLHIVMAVKVQKTPALSELKKKKKSKRSIKSSVFRKVGFGSCINPWHRTNGKMSSPGLEWVTKGHIVLQARVLELVLA